jgi:hypothetical protein
MKTFCACSPSLPDSVHMNQFILRTMTTPILGLIPDNTLSHCGKIFSIQVYENLRKEIETSFYISAGRKWTEDELRMDWSVEGGRFQLFDRFRNRFTDRYKLFDLSYGNNSLWVIRGLAE